MGLIDELKRRKVFKIGAAYLVVAWLLIQVTATVAPQLDFPIWVPRVITFVLLLGFPIALVFAWVFDLTPDGVKVESGTRGTRVVLIVAAALVALAVGWYFKGQPSYRKGDIPADPGSPSVAVLPFANMSGNPDEEYFSDGMTEELLNVLAKIPGLKVAARTSVFEFKGKGGDVRKIGATLGVSHIVEGSVRRDGGQVRVTAQLVRVADGFHLWSENYDRELKGVFALQDELAGRIGEQLQRKLGVGEAPAPRVAIAPEAYDEYLKGRALYRQRRDLPLAVSHLARAVELAPQFAAGWASLALAHEVVYWTTSDAQREAVGDSYALMVAATEQAGKLDPAAAMTLHARANVARAQARFHEAEKLYQAAIKADPSYPDVREDYAELVVDAGYYAEGEAAIRELLALDPRSTLFWWRLMSLGVATERVELVDEASAKIRDIDPDNARGPGGRYLLALSRGDRETARTELAAAERKAPGVMAKDALMFHWAVGDEGADEAQARNLIAELTMRSIYAVVRNDKELFFASYDNPHARMAQTGLYLELSSPVGRQWLSDARARNELARKGFVAYWRVKGWPPLCRPLAGDDFECGEPAVEN